MKDKYLISITTVDGTKHYSVSKIIKKIVLFLIILFILIGIVGVIYIKVLENQKEKISLQKEKLQTKLLTLQQELYKINKELLLKKDEIIQKEITLNKLKDKINNLETKMRLKKEIFTSNISLKDIPKDLRYTILKLIPNGKPIKVIQVTSKFGWRIHPILKKREFHPGVDLRGRGLVPVRATADGIVLGAGLNPYGYGYVVKIANVFGFSILYGHLRRNLKVKTGDFVRKGQIIGYMGNTGLSTGQHLHYEIRYNNKPLNPIYFINWNLNNFSKIFKVERNVPWQSLIKAIQILKQPSFPQKQ